MFIRQLLHIDFIGKVNMKILILYILLGLSSVSIGDVALIEPQTRFVLYQKLCKSISKCPRSLDSIELNAASGNVASSLARREPQQRGSAASKSPRPPPSKPIQSPLPKQKQPPKQQSPPKQAPPRQQSPPLKGTNSRSKPASPPRGASPPAPYKFPAGKSLNSLPPTNAFVKKAKSACQSGPSNKKSSCACSSGNLPKKLFLANESYTGGETGELRGILEPSQELSAESLVKRQDVKFEMDGGPNSVWWQHPQLGQTQLYSPGVCGCSAIYISRHVLGLLRCMSPPPPGWALRT